MEKRHITLAKIIWKNLSDTEKDNLKYNCGTMSLCDCVCLLLGLNATNEIYDEILSAIK